MRRFWGLIAGATVLLAGCALQRAQDAARAQEALVGVSKERILQCMGAPVARAEAGQTEVWTYQSGDNRTTAFGAARNGFFSGSSVTRSCKIDVVMSRDRVVRVQYSGLTGGLLTEGEQCAYAVENC